MGKRSRLVVREVKRLKADDVLAALLLGEAGKVLSPLAAGGRAMSGDV